MTLTGIHHLTAVSARIADNHRFYTRTLGMRLVKRSVNQDDVSAYHLFYADGAGSPGTDLTFFDWPVPRERRGTHSIVRSFLRVRDEASVHWWSVYLGAAGVPAGAPFHQDGRATLLFEDPEGQRLGLIEDGGAGDPPVSWPASGIPEQYQIRGLGPVVLSVPDPGPTALVLERVMGMREVRGYAAEPVLTRGWVGNAVPGEGLSAPVQVRVFAMEEGGAHAEVHVAAEPGLPPAQPGAGGVHHVAFRVSDDRYEEWARRLAALRVPNSGPVDRYYFKSLYFREPNGILFELATDGPGFAVDEDAATLGESVVLPPFLEPRRREILAGLKPID
jgi:glyoxalase family protein